MGALSGLTLPRIDSSYKEQAFLEKVVAIFDGQLGSMQLRAMMMMKISTFSSWQTILKCLGELS